MYVSVDCEGGDGNAHLASISYGREDGTSASLTGVTEREMLCWLVDELSGHYVDEAGTEFIQVPVAFHFGWDSAMFAKQFLVAERDDLGVNTGFATPGMRIVRKAQANLNHATLLCGQDHDRIEECDRWRARHGLLEGMTEAELQEAPQLLHVWDGNDVAAVIAEGGEGDLLAWEEDSGLGIAITPGRRFYLEHRPNGDRYEGWRRVDIHDNGSSFVGGLLSVIDQWKPELTPEQHAAIEWGKRARKEGFLGGTLAQVTAYSEAECVAHARCSRLLIDTVRDAAHVLIDPREHFGSGSIAGATLQRFRCPTRMPSRRDGTPGTHREEREVEPGITVDDIASLTYFGGMIETPVVGLVPGKVDQVDLNSAYPAQMIHLPCLNAGHGTWKTRRGDWTDRWTGPRKAVIGHVRATWAVKGTSTPPFMVRGRNGGVSQPLAGLRTWVTLAEYQAARERFGADVRAHETWWWEQSCDCGNPLAFLGDLYARRLALKDAMKAEIKDSTTWQTLNCRQNAIKLVINSIYGKLAQQRPTPGKYTNLHWASYITGATRAEVRRETWRREAEGGTVVYQHTDSVLSVGGQPIDGGKALGAWGLEDPANDFLVLQPGLAVSLGGGKSATRGVSRDVFTRVATEFATTEDLTTHPTTWPELLIEDERMVTLHLALHRGKPETAGLFLPHPLKVKACSSKRDLERAVPIEGIPTAWAVPPWEFVHEQATLADIRAYRSMMIKRALRGELGRHSDGA